MAGWILQNAVKEEGIEILTLHPGWFSSDMGGGGIFTAPAEAAKDIMKLVSNPPGTD